MTDIVVKFDEKPTVIKLSQGAQGDAGVGVPPGGTADQVLKKNSRKSYDTSWTDAVLSVNGKVGNVEMDYTDVGAASSAQGALADTALQAVPDTYRTSKEQDEIDATNIADMDAAKISKDVGQAKGDLITFKGGSNPVRLPVGVNGQVLTVDNTTDIGLVWRTSQGGSGGGGSSAVTLHAPEGIGPVPAYTIVCLDGTETDGVPNLKLATGVTAGVDLYVTQETVTGADVSCMYAIGAIATVRFEGTDAVVGDPISVSLSTAGVGCATNAYPTVGVAVMPPRMERFRCS